MRTRRVPTSRSRIAVLALGAATLVVTVLAGPASAGAPGPGAPGETPVVDTWPGPYADAPLTAGMVPGAEGVLSPKNPKKCARAAAGAGWERVDLVVGVAVMLGESGCDPKARSTNPPSYDCPAGSVDRGAWQINDCYHSEVTDECAYNLKCSSEAAYGIWEDYGFSQWTVYRLRLFKSHLNEARKAVKRVTGENIVVGVVWTTGGDLTIRKKPRTSSEAVGTYPKDTIIEIVCQTRGEKVYSEVFDYETKLWDSTGPHQYVSDGYVYTDTPKRVAPKCARGW